MATKYCGMISPGTVFGRAEFRRDTPLTHRPNGWDAADPIAEPAVWCPADRGPIPGQDPTWHRPPAGVAGRGRGLARSGRWGELLAVIERHGDRAMDFVWRHKGALTISTILATFLAEPEVFLGGGRELMSEAAQELTQPQVEAADSVAGRPLPAWPYPWR
jgi:hypothetical protein